MVWLADGGAVEVCPVEAGGELEASEELEEEDGMTTMVIGVAPMLMPPSACSWSVSRSEVRMLAKLSSRPVMAGPEGNWNRWKTAEASVRTGSHKTVHLTVSVSVLSCSSIDTTSEGKTPCPNAEATLFFMSVNIASLLVPSSVAKLTPPTSKENSRITGLCACPASGAADVAEAVDDSADAWGDVEMAVPVDEGEGAAVDASAEAEVAGADVDEAVDEAADASAEAGVAVAADVGEDVDAAVDAFAAVDSAGASGVDEDLGEAVDAFAKVDSACSAVADEDVDEACDASAEVDSLVEGFIVVVDSADLCASARLASEGSFTGEGSFAGSSIALSEASVSACRARLMSCLLPTSRPAPAC